MEYSPMMIVILWALTPSDCATLRDSEEAAVVKEVPKPSTTVQNLHEYRLPGYFTFNDGKPFLVEKDPLTGALDFNIKTTPVGSSKFSEDYFYEDEEDNGKDQIDRKDTNVGATNNDIKAQADLHKFLNLPVHYSTHGKYPLISSSYANTKVQGHGSSSYSNHRTHSTQSTPSTPPPTYYTLRTTSGSPPATPKAATEVTPSPTAATTTTTTTTTSTTTTTTTPAYSEYEYVDYDYDKFEMESDSKHPTTATVTTTTLRPTTTEEVVVKTSGRPTLPTTTDKKNHTVTETPNVKIVTSLPVKEYTENEYTTENYFTFSTTKRAETYKEDKNKTNSAHGLGLSTESATVSVTRGTPSKISFGARITEKPVINYDNSDRRNVSFLYRPIPEVNVNNKVTDNQSEGDRFREKPTSSYDTTQRYTTTEKPSVVSKEDVYVTYAQPAESVTYTQSVSTNYLTRRPPPVDGGASPPTVEFRPPFREPAPQLTGTHPPIRNYSTIFNQQHLSGHNTTGQNHNAPAIITDEKNIFDLRPPPTGKYPFFKPSRPDSHIFVPPDYLQSPSYLSNEKHESTKFPLYQTESTKVEIKKPIEGVEITPEFTNKPYIRGSVVGNKDEMLFKVTPERRPPTLGEQPSRFPQFHQPTQVDNHFIRVSPGQANPSYSLQTSFSIGVPPPESEFPQETRRPGQGVGQVLFPDEEPASRRPEVVKRPGSWAGERPPPRAPDNYPRPQWEAHLKPPQFFGHPAPIQKPDLHPHPHQPPPKRPKPQGGLQRHDLPNILPQFRPNAKIGHGDYHAHFSGPMPKLREPLDTLQPPPLPRPQHLRLNRNEEAEVEKIDGYFGEKGPAQPSPVNRRTGPQPGSVNRVTTLQMMQQGPPRRAVVRAEYKDGHSPAEKEEPVFVVYPSNGNTKNSIPNDDVVVVGTRGPHRPLPPDNLGLDEDPDPFPLDDKKDFQIHAKDRIDTPILKTKPTPKPVIKNEFPYPLVKASEFTEKEEKPTTITKEYTAFSPTEHTNADLMKEHDSEINIIPYLQDYMPFATKKPISSKPVEIPGWNLDEKSTLKPISVTLNTKFETTGESHQKKDDKPGQAKYPIVSFNHRPAEEGPQPQDFQAPFHASLSAPSQGWTIVSTKSPSEADREEPQLTTEKPPQQSKFDIENFKPQLFGGFKPILPPVLSEGKTSSGEKTEAERKQKLFVYI